MEMFLSDSPQQTWISLIVFTGGWPAVNKHESLWSCLQEAEQQSIEMATKLEGVKEEKERLLNSLVEAE